MEKDKLIESVLLIVVIILFAIILQWAGWIDIMANITDIFIAIASFFLGIAFVWLKQGLFPKYEKKGKENEYDPIQNQQLDDRYSHLSIYFSQRTETPFTKSQSRPRYIVNHNTKQAYWVSTYVDLNIKGKTNWHTFDGEKAVEEYFKEQNITINKRDPTIVELGL